MCIRDSPLRVPDLGRRIGDCQKGLNLGRTLGNKKVAPQRLVVINPLNTEIGHDLFSKQNIIDTEVACEFAGVLGQDGRCSVRHDLG